MSIETIAETILSDSQLTHLRGLVELRLYCMKLEKEAGVTALWSSAEDDEPFVLRPMHDEKSAKVWREYYDYP